MTSGLKDGVGNGTSVVLLTLVVIFDDVTTAVTFGEFEVLTMTGLGHEVVTETKQESVINGKS